MDKKVEQQGFDAGSERGKLHWNAPDITKLEFPATAAGIGQYEAAKWLSRLREGRGIRHAGGQEHDKSGVDRPGMPTVPAHWGNQF